ncbi:MAG: beta-ketoacyl-ACP synthase II [Bacteroidetes bacterium]|uniref:3-oxoacyl-[acyl-carrier-protein] synthase 2 n=1 Tax=Candidatus Cryptobacteroides avistercoris TaxID=2840758 RepID=A0A9D9IX92_9BACT|nr:beta-ketoacyl-ACP synthase II [Candidatus Cryptobacteroides avistercoris]
MKRVVITGMGVISPVGNDVNTFWESLKAGKCGISRLEGFEEYNLPIHVAGRVKDFDPLQSGLSAAEKRRNDIYSQYALAAAAQAMAESGLVSNENIDENRFGIYFGSGIGGIQTFVTQTKILFDEGADRISPLFIPMMIPNIAGGNIAIKYKAKGPCLTHVSACATGTNSIGEAYLAIKYGRADAILAGGSEAAVTPLAIGGFANAKALTYEEDPAKACLPFDARRGGFVMSEGAGALMLEEREHAIARGANIIAEVCGYGCTCDAHHYTAPRPDGITAGRALREALDEAGYKPGENLYINAHGTGTHLNDSTETTAIKVALGEEDAHRASVSSTKSMHGHMFGATGAVELIASALALRDGIVPPTIGLEVPDPECDLDYTPGEARKRDLDIAISNSLGFGGHNVCVSLRRA